MVTLKNWELLARQNKADSLGFDLFMFKFKRPDYHEWSDAVESALSHQCSEMVRGRHHLQKSSEDALTWTIIIGLRNLGLDARMDVVGGNCDLTIGFAGEYLWIGEAKIWRGPSYVWGGYQQLATRYATGLPNHSRGGMLIYLLNHSAPEVLTEWRATLGGQVEDIAIEEDPQRGPSFWSTAPHQSTGVPFKVRHLVFPLQSEPKDREAALSEETKEALKDVRKNGG